MMAGPAREKFGAKRAARLSVAFRATRFVRPADLALNVDDGLPTRPSRYRPPSSLPRRVVASRESPGSNLLEEELVRSQLQN